MTRICTVAQLIIGATFLLNRYSERRESAEELTKRVNLRSI
jgi:hypothetical protein